MALRTIPALKQAIYAALTAPPLTYRVNDGSQQTVPASSVIAMAPVDAPVTPDPMVNVTVGSRGKPQQQLGFREAEIRIWASSGQPGADDLVDEIYAAVLARLESPNAEAPSALSRTATGTTLGIAILTVREISKMPARFDAESQRTYVSAELRAIAQ